MKNLKKVPRKQLEKFSTIFTQLGLVLSLFVVFVILEHQTEQKVLAIKDVDLQRTVEISPNEVFEFVREPKLIPKTDNLPKNVFIIDEKYNEVDNNTKETTVDVPQETESNQFNIKTVVTLNEPVIEEPETVPFINIENAPVFKGCEGLSKEENKKCFNSKMMQFVQRNFDSELASSVGLRSGKYNIQTQFIIDKNGNVVDIKIRAPHAKLTKETQQLIEKLPKFTPGKQRDKPVKVSYVLPISFQVD